MCTNNQYGMSQSVKDAMAVKKISDRAAAYSMPGVTVDGNDLLAVYEATKQAVDRARSGDGPSLVEGVTYRWLGHSKSDANRYRTKEEIEYWKARCPIKAFEKYLVTNGVIPQAKSDAMVAAAKDAIDKAVEFAQNSPFPGLDTLENDVYA